MNNEKLWHKFPEVHISWFSASRLFTVGKLLKRHMWKIANRAKLDAKVSVKCVFESVSVCECVYFTVCVLMCLCVFGSSAALIVCWAKVIMTQSIQKICSSILWLKLRKLKREARKDFYWGWIAKCEEHRVHWVIASNTVDAFISWEKAPSH